MKYLRWVGWCAFVLSCVPSLVSADEPSIADRVRTWVEAGIVRPLAERAASSFSRARPPPLERRVRVLQSTAIGDKTGRPFVPFAIDSRFVGGGPWQTNDIVGCAYVGKGELFVKRGDGYRPAAFLFGKNSDPVPGACEAAPPGPRNP